MRRALATLLMAVFSFSLISPALFAADPDSKLPLCCRRAGNHHCTLQADQRESGPAVKSASCPFYPTASVFPATRTAGLPGMSGVVFTGIVNHSAAVQRAATLCRSSYSRTGQKRGPPSSIA
jgi:hypothetical protein